MRKSEQEVQRQREALHQSEKMTALGSLLAGVAHELNNPPSVVIGRAIMLEEDARDPVQKERLKKLRKAAERCTWPSRLSRYDEWCGLAPLSVEPRLQRRGIGQGLVRQGLAEIARRAGRGCVVVGEAGYYGRFGFKADAGLTLAGLPPEYFLAKALDGAPPRGAVAITRCSFRLRDFGAYCASSYA